MNKVLIGVLPAVSILLAIVTAVVFYNIEDKTEKSKFILKHGWIWLLVLQGVYLSLDVVEGATEKDIFGITASCFMIGLGIFILIVTALEKYHGGELEKHGLIEGLFYLLFGITLLVLRIRNHANRLKEEEEAEKEKEKCEKMEEEMKKK
jgi:hypothetical protein